MLASAAPWPRISQQWADAQALAGDGEAIQGTDVTCLPARRVRALIDGALIASFRRRRRRQDRAALALGSLRLRRVTARWTRQREAEVQRRRPSSRRRRRRPSSERWRAARRSRSDTRAPSAGEQGARGKEALGARRRDGDAKRPRRHHFVERELLEFESGVSGETARGEEEPQRTQVESAARWRTRSARPRGGWREEERQRPEAAAATSLYRARAARARERGQRVPWLPQPCAGRREEGRAGDRG